jgi:hypothetical protein
LKIKIKNMGASAFAMTNDINDYPEEVSDVVDELIHLQIINDGEQDINAKLRGWIINRLTMLANISHLGPRSAVKLPSQTKRQIARILKNPETVLQFRL